MSAAHDPGPVAPRANPPYLFRPTPSLHQEFQHLRSHWWWFMLMGVLLVVCGTIAIIAPPVATDAAVDVLAILFLICGAATIVSSFWTGHWSGAIVNVLIGVLYVVIGFAITEQPLRTAAVLTLFIAVLFTISGTFRTITALSIRFPQWGWALLNGVVTLLMGIYILRHYQNVWFWVPGLIVGVEMLMAGWTWIMLAMGIRAIPQDAVA